ncbi:hypothetical protein [uncultured Clostridium sp.]|uniref:hypothetical protein n=1 Tax=uncultured Clostridium sp. TaxID=59620 RepID=UPI0026054D53|nr:hypothetical protein [uncultured Clostridium sp.]
MINIFSIDELIYIVKVIYNDIDEDEYRFKKILQDKINELDFNKYLTLIEKSEKISLKLENSHELNSLNNLHMEIQEEVLKNLSEYIK